MNVLLLTLSNIQNIDSSGIYEDLLREFAKNNNNVYIISPIERRYKETSHIISFDGNDWQKNVKIIKIKTGNIQKTNFLEKGISTVLLESQIVKGIRKYMKNIQIDLLLYSTPPITLTKPIKYIKKRYNAMSYLMLKDIFPQNAVDLKILSKKGWKGIIYRFFRRKEKKLYKLSDKIGCMSPANVKYILENNEYIPENKVEVCPNSIEVKEIKKEFTRSEIRVKYNLPLDKRIFVYGGNLGKPQACSYLIDCIDAMKNDDTCFFLVIGNGTEFEKLYEYSKINSKNFMLLRSLNKTEFDQMIFCCDVGLIFLDYRFTIPNFPSRVLSYMQAELPVFVCTDNVCDLGSIAENNNFGWKCNSLKVESFLNAIENIKKSEKLIDMGHNAYNFMVKNYNSKDCYDLIFSSYNSFRGK